MQMAGSHGGVYGAVGLRGDASRASGDGRLSDAITITRSGREIWRGRYLLNQLGDTS